MSVSISRIEFLNSFVVACRSKTVFCSTFQCHVFVLNSVMEFVAKSKYAILEVRISEDVRSGSGPSGGFLWQVYGCLQSAP
jgi:hypothetical protein